MSCPNHYLFRYYELREPLQFLAEDPQWSDRVPSFTTADWDLLKRVVRVLKDFYDATETLSHRSASIAEVQAVISTSLLNLLSH